MANFLRRMWGGAQVATERTVRGIWIDTTLLVGIGGFVYAFYNYAQGAHRVHEAMVEIHLSLWYLPLYTFYSLCRGLVAYLISLSFTLVYAYWAAKDHRAERVLIPILDILQSIPVLAFLPGLVLALVRLFPHSNLGLELAAVILIFTGQAWNMTFSLYRSLRTVPIEMGESATIFRFPLWQRIMHVEMPGAALGLVWNSMMSMAGGWFFLSLCEAGQVGDYSYRLPGLGSYVAHAYEVHDKGAIAAGIVAMITMIVLLDQLMWRPLVVWAQRFRNEDAGAVENPTSWFLSFLRRSRVAGGIGACVQACANIRLGAPALPAEAPIADHPRPPLARKLTFAVGWLPSALLAAGVLWGAVVLVKLILDVHGRDWLRIFGAAGVTTMRVVLAIVLGTLWTVPAGLAIGLSPKLSRLLQPVIQVAASFPAPMLFPLVIALALACHVQLAVSSVLLMVLGTQWYILFNVIAGTMAIPADLRESARVYNIRGWALFRRLYLPAIFPYLITGWVTASGGAWNTSIVAEYYKDSSMELSTFGLGAMITTSSNSDNHAMLAATVLMVCVIVVGINRLLWHRLYHVAETTYSLNK